MRAHFLTLALLTAAFGAQAQTGLKLGLKGGVSLSSFTGADADNVENRLGFHAGILANFGLTDQVSLQPELLYSQKGAASETVKDLTYKLNYVDVPVLAHIKAGGLFFELGPQVGFLVAAKDEVGSLTIDRKATYNEVDFGYVAGLGYQLSSGPGVGLRYNGGFGNAPEKIVRSPTVTVQQRLRNSAFQLYVTYLLGGK